MISKSKNNFFLALNYIIFKLGNKATFTHIMYFLLYLDVKFYQYYGRSFTKTYFKDGKVNTVFKKFEKGVPEKYGEFFTLENKTFKNKKRPKEEINVLAKDIIKGVVYLFLNLSEEDVKTTFKNLAIRR